jgi:hypothetical protein
MRPSNRLAPSAARRTVLCVVIACALCVSGVATAGAEETIAPIPKIHDVTSLVRIGGRQDLLVKSFEIYGIAGLKLRVSCERCKRFRGKIDKSHPAPGATLFQGVNWILQPGLVISVAVFHTGQVGRYLRLGALTGPHPSLIFKSSGCLASLLRVQSCPQGTSLPSTGAPVPQAPPATGSQQPTPVPATTPMASLSVSISGHGSGTVSVSGIPCPGNCFESFAVGTVVSLTAQPSANSVFAGVFAGWSDGCTGHGTCTVTIGTDQTITATFGVLGDLSGDGYVGCADLAILREYYGKSGTEIIGGISGAEIIEEFGQEYKVGDDVDLVDLTLLSDHWNPPPGEAPCPSE